MLRAVQLYSEKVNGEGDVMMKTLYLIGIALLLITGCARKETLKTPPAESYIAAVIERLNTTGMHISDMTGAADDAASRLVRGGRIRITDDESLGLSGEDKERVSRDGGVVYNVHENSGGIVAEACDRAGGLGAIKPYSAAEQLTVDDVVLVGTLDLHPEEQGKQLAAIRDSGALIILFGSRAARCAPYASYVIDNGLDSGLCLTMDVGGASRTGPVAGVANVINMWTFTAELVAALTRQGKMPTLWQSMYVPGAEARNERIGKSMFEADFQIQPIPSGALGKQYVTAVHGFLESIQAQELPRFHKTGALCAETISRGGKVVTWLIGHFMASQNRMPGTPAPFAILGNEDVLDQLREKLGGEDVFLHVGYSYYPRRELLIAREKGAKTICVMTPGPAITGEGAPVNPDMSLIDIYIDPFWKHGDAVVEVPGYDTKIIPPSGVVMATCYWMIIGETMAHHNTGDRQ